MYASEQLPLLKAIELTVPLTFGAHEFIVNGAVALEAEHVLTCERGADLKDVVERPHRIHRVAALDQLTYLLGRVRIGHAEMRRACERLRQHARARAGTPPEPVAVAVRADAPLRAISATPAPSAIKYLRIPHYPTFRARSLVRRRLAERLVARRRSRERTPRAGELGSARAEARGGGEGGGGVGG